MPVTIQSPTLFFNDMHRSFALLRMTTKRNAVILTEGKDLYEMCLDNIPNPPSYLGLTTNPEL